MYVCVGFPIESDKLTRLVDRQGYRDMDAVSLAERGAIGDCTVVYYTSQTIQADNMNILLPGGQEGF